ncbi:MAG TPA: hypothetical protein VJA84_00180 [Candidatus Omnitrophota bacterium]|nr:hypothetical protein [Candidatus Omnitrophota bacterium]
MKDQSQVKVLGAAGAVIIGFFIFQNFFVPRDDIGLCRHILKKLVNSSSSVEKLIDWEALKSGEVEVGKTFSGYSDPKQKLVYKNAFIRSFSLSFKLTGAKLGDFYGWRVYARDSQKTTVAVDGKGGTVYFSLSNPRYGNKKLIDIQWKLKEPSQP